MGNFKGGNSKAMAAKEKKKLAKLEQDDLKQKEKEEKLSKEWQKGSKKISKKEIDMEKRQLHLQEKKEREELLRKEQASIKSVAARTVDDAIDIFKKEKVDKHPERRVKAAYESFKERRIVELKAENPTLRLSQLQQLLFKEFQKSPENPMNQANVKYNTSKQDIEAINEQLTDQKLDTLGNN